MELVTLEPALLIWTLLAMTNLILAIIALIQIAGKDFKDVNVKLIWTLMILFLPIVGPVLYFFIGKKTQVNFK